MPEPFNDTTLTAAIVVVDDALRAVARANLSIGVADNPFLAPLREHLEGERIRLLTEAVARKVYSAEPREFPHTEFVPDPLAPGGQRAASQIEIVWGPEVHAAVKGGRK